MSELCGTTIHPNRNADLVKGVLVVAGIKVQMVVAMVTSVHECGHRDEANRWASDGAQDHCGGEE